MCYFSLCLALQAQGHVANHYTSNVYLCLKNSVKNWFENGLGSAFFSLVNSSIIQSLFMQNHLLNRYFHFNCRKKPWGKKKRKNASVFEAGIVFFKILMFYCVTSTPMDSTGNSGKCCLEITWASLVVEAEAASTQVSPACALTHTTNTHTHISVSVCMHIHTKWQLLLAFTIFSSLQSLTQVAVS